MSLNFTNKLTKDKTRHTIANIRSNQNILLTQLKNFMTPTSALSRQRSKSKNNYSTKNIYINNVGKKEKSIKEKDEIIKKLKEKIMRLENKIKILEFKVQKLSKANSKFPTSTKHSKNHSISGKEYLNDKKNFKSIIAPKKKYSLKSEYSKKRMASQLLTEENIFDIKEKCNTNINKNNNVNISSNIVPNSKDIIKNIRKNKKKIEVNYDKCEKKKQTINYHNINEILKKAIIKKTHLRKKSKHLKNLNDLHLKTSISKLISKIPKTSRHYYQTESNINLSSKITSSTTFNYYKQNNSNIYSETNNVLTSNNIYTEEGDAKQGIANNNINNNSNEFFREKLNQIRMRTAHLLELFTGFKMKEP